MADSNPPKSPTLVVPRKSVELEDPGAHELESSADEEDIFSDAREGVLPPTSPVPLTRVEKVDNAPSHGEVPGTTAYSMRTQDAVPDEIEVLPEGSSSRPSSRTGGSPQPSSPGGTPIPKTRVEKVDPTSPSHGEIPGTFAHELRKADAVPDAIVKAGETSQSSDPDDKEFAGGGGSPSIPTTVVTRVDSLPSHGEVPGTDAYKMRSSDADPDIVEKKRDIPSKHISHIKPSHFEALNHTSLTGGNSPIAPDGGFGPMHFSDDDDEEDDSESKEEVGDDQSEHNMGDSTEENDEAKGDDAGFGDDFDDFEEGAQADDDFDEFDDHFQQPEKLEQAPPPRQVVTPVSPPHAVLDYSSLNSLDDIIEATSSHFATLFPKATKLTFDPPPPLPDSSSTFLTERSLSLWSQLVAPPPLQPPNWVRSRIRRLFLVSLGVPVDLDEILPKSKQKKLILPYTSSESHSASKDSRKGSVARLKTDAGNASDSSPSTPMTANPHKSALRKRKGPPPPPEFDMSVVRLLSSTTDAALESMSDTELRKHVEILEGLVERGKEVLQYWVRRKEAAVGEKEAFDGVIENLVRHARRVRK